MATYFCSDPHGEYDLFMRLTERAGFSDSDVLYVLGDVIDKGKDGFRLLDFFRRSKNVRVLSGNHEYVFRQFYIDYTEEFETCDPDRVLERLKRMYDDRYLTWDLVDYIDVLPYYFEEKDFICVHAGLQPDGKGGFLPPTDCSARFLCFDRQFKEESTVYHGEKTVLFGHTPCHYENGTGEFIKTLKEGKNIGQTLADYAKIRLDCGVFFTGRLGLLRKEDMREIYVTKEGI